MKNYALLILTTIFVSSTITAQLKPVKYADEGQVLNGLSIKSAKKSSQNPGILLLPAWLGIDNASKGIAENLSKLGYHVFIADIYGEGNYPKNTAEAGKLAGFYKQNVAAYQKRIDLALQELVKSGANADNIVAIGYCFGGTGVLEAARGHLNVKGVASFHGGLGKDAARTAEPITTKVLVCHGADDPFVPTAEITAFQQEMRDSKADWQMIYYANSVHSFTNPEAGNDNSKGAAYNEKAAKRAFEHLQLFLNEVLKK
ncbi:dienelactone hydrolase family protein [Flavobacterium sp. Fl-77]|uniref:Dienelactone hydrolase family protein n=1 Tax=Flavobacterium flavipigmentatum TaxID=2893884 RepID=A0AAJ2SAF5_9FLAO|nr:MULTISPECIES: dienelactone hydrolase family protein [unclassified Flavobacterium]MDX6183427.1 dienelactone hydrolase family protein [Flavobacterium sp. Fl-33]MDX6186711.1 dienelactone hydrolase family protein [Flavobacterium sp. Fl-77]UFH38521.1 dienelactone hydrolase family protein [Flavobacterium sp. F-70]